MISALPRRAALLGAATLLGAAGLPDPAQRVSAAAPAGPGLNAVALQNGLFYGAAIGDGLLADDPAYMNQVVLECGIVTGENAFKWDALHPARGTYDFSRADRIMAFAERHAIMVRGHTLLWHAANPSWLADTLTPGNAETILRDHVRTVAGHCRNRVVHWDVANEVLAPEEGRPFGLRDSVWTRALGFDCIDIAFHQCAETDPGPLRCINEFGVEYDWVDQDAKRADLLALLTRLKARGVPVQALGLQAHLEAGVMELNQSKLAQFCADVAGLGLKIVITELDVRDNRLGGDPALRDAAIASHARAYLDAVLSCPAVLGVVSWGLSDRRSWLNDTLPRADKLPQRPLPLDDGLRRKPLWQAMADAFAAAPPRA